MPTGWRIVKTKYAKNAFSGAGARLYGGRWGSPGVEMVYTSSSRSLAILEILVHINDDSLLSRYSLCAVHFTDDLIHRISPKELPKNWRDYPAPASLQKIGNNWVKKSISPVLEVPSAVEGTESNYLLNPNHPDFHLIRIDPCQPYIFDARLKR